MGTGQDTIRQPLFQFYENGFLLIFLYLCGFNSSALKIDPKFWKYAGSRLEKVGVVL